MKWRAACSGVLIVTMITGCASTGTPPQLDYYAAPPAAPAASIKKIGIVYDTHVQYRGSLFWNYDSDKTPTAAATRQAATTVETLTQRQLGEKGYTFVKLPEDDQTRALLKQLADARGDAGMPFHKLKGDATKAAPFQLAAALATKYQVDALAIVSVNDTTYGLEGKAEIIAILIPISAIFLLGGHLPGDSGDSEYCAYCRLEFTLFDHGGKIIFYDRKNPDPEDVQNLSVSMEAIFAELQQAGKPQQPVKKTKGG